MPDESAVTAQRLSELVERAHAVPTNRRNFLGQASTLSLIVGGAALTACRPNGASSDSAAATDPRYRRFRRSVRFGSTGVRRKSPCA